MSIQNIAIVGQGNVGYWFYEQLSQQQQYNVQIFSSREIAQLPSCFDFYLFSIKDDCYEEVLAEITFPLPLAAHTSGSLSQSILAPFTEHYGVIYPLQTLSKSQKNTPTSVPLCIEGDDAVTEQDLLEIAYSISENSTIIREEQRQIMHLAAVFSCNFTNAMYRISHQLLQEANLPFKLLAPLIEQTLAKLKEMTPAEAQTGPAKRHDTTIMEKHLEALKEKPDEQAIYKILSEYIQAD